MSISKNKGNGKVLLSDVRLSYANIFEPRAMQQGQEPKYSTAILVDKSDTKTINVIKQAMEEAKQSFVEKFGGKFPANAKLPLRDGDVEREGEEAYANHYFFNASSKQAPQVLNSAKQLANDDDVYSGAYVYVTLSFYPFNNSGNKGIAVGLENIMKQRDGERLAGGATAEEDFADIEAEDLDLSFL